MRLQWEDRERRGIREQERGRKTVLRMLATVPGVSGIGYEVGETWLDQERIGHGLREAQSLPADPDTCSRFAKGL